MQRFLYKKLTFENVASMVSATQPPVPAASKVTTDSIEDVLASSQATSETKNEMVECMSAIWQNLRMEFDLNQLSDDEDHSVLPKMKSTIRTVVNHKDLSDHGKSLILKAFDKISVPAEISIVINKILKAY